VPNEKKMRKPLQSWENKAVGEEITSRIYRTSRQYLSQQWKEFESLMSPAFLSITLKEFVHLGFTLSIFNSIQSVMCF